MTCTNCGQPHLAGQTRCGHCNYKLPPTLAIPVPTPAAPALIACRNCKHANHADALRCEQCNIQISPAQSRAATIAQS